MKVSVIISTYNGERKIETLLQSLAAQSFKEFELIVVIDGSKDNTIDVITKYKTQFLELKIIEQENKGRAGARNTGAINASSKNLIFFDDDLGFEFDLIEKYLAEIKNGAEIIVGVAIAQSKKINSDFYDYSNYLNNKWHLAENESSTSFLNAQNCFISKPCFEILEGFDERLRDSEDYDLGIRAINHGFKIIYSSSLVVSHQIQESFEEYANRQIEYKKSREVLYLLKPHLRNESRPKGGRFRKYIDMPFRYKIWIQLIDKNFFILFPTKFRFRLYDFLLRAYSVSH